MIDEYEVEEAIQRNLVDNWSGDTVSFAFEDQEKLPDRPYIALEIVKVSGEDPTLDGTAQVLVQYLQATVVCERGTFQKQAGRIARAIKPLFPHGKTFDITDAQITVMKHPFIQSGFPDGFDWRIPVRIDYEVSNV